jgi:hypothetical protein
VLRSCSAGSESIEQVEKAAQHGVADIAVQPWHRPWHDVVHPVSDDHVRTAFERFQETGDLLEVVGLVRVRGDDVGAAGGGEPGQVGAAVTPPLLVHDPSSRGRRECRAVVLGTIISDDHLAVDLVFIENLTGRADTGPDALFLVQAGNDNRNLHPVGRSSHCPQPSQEACA